MGEHEDDEEICGSCGHFHLARTDECPEPGESCGDYRCCH